MVSDETIVKTAKLMQEWIESVSDDNPLSHNWPVPVVEAVITAYGSSISVEHFCLYDDETGLEEDADGGLHLHDEERLLKHCKEQFLDHIKMYKNFLKETTRGNRSSEDSEGMHLPRNEQE